MYISGHCIMCFHVAIFVGDTLDVMHYEKNICENMLKTIFGEKDIRVQLC
jgi:hypothetical protein